MSDVSLSARYGIPVAVVINDDNRFPGCIAHEATLVEVSPDGRLATYKGVCPQGHIYQHEMDVQELKRKTRVVVKNGEQVYEHEDKVKISGEQELEEY